jgi:hypothetical protein
MAAKARLKSVGYIAFGLICIAAIFLFGALFLYGMVWVSGKLLPWLFDASGIALVVCVFVLLPLCILRKTRPWAGLGFQIASYVFGTMLFAFSCIVAVELWGYGGLLVGLALAGAGVVPIALLAALFHAEWILVGDILFGLILTFGTRHVGLRLLASDRAEPRHTETVRGSSRLIDLPPPSRSTARSTHVDDPEIGRSPLPSSEVGMADVKAIQVYCRHAAKEWWRSQQREVAICDACNSPILRDEGYLMDGSLRCDTYFDPRCSPDAALINLRYDNDHYGVGLVDEARDFVGMRPRN